LDEIDFQIISILSKDARIPFKEIAIKLGVAPKTVLKRFNRLKQEGIILGSMVVLSSKACGFKLLAGFLIKIKSGVSISLVESKLCSISQINSLWIDSGKYDLYGEAFFRDLSELYEAINEIRGIEEVFALSLIFISQDQPIPFIPPISAFCQSLLPKVSQTK